MQADSNHSTHSHSSSNTDNSHDRNSVSSKSSMYRAMVARTDASQWRGAARSKMDAAILYGSANSSGLQAVAHDDQDPPVLHNDHDNDDNQCKDVSMNKSSEDVEPTDEVSLDESTTNIARNSSEASTSEALLNLNPANHIEEEEEDGDEEGPKADASEPNEEDNDSDNKSDDQTASTEEATHNMEPEIPCKYLNWEDEIMEDVELGNDSVYDHVGELPMDDRAFEKARAMEEQNKRERRQQRRKQICLGTVAFLLLSAVVCLPIWMILGLSRSQNNKKETSVVVTEEQVNGFIAPLEHPVLSNTGEEVSVQFPESILVPQGSTVLYKVYDGPDCSGRFEGGANDITGQNNYVEAALYSNEPLEQQRGGTSMGVLFSWETDQVELSPLYRSWSTPSSSNSSPGGASPYATMDFCMELSMLDSNGLRVHHQETYIMATWMGSFLQKVRTVPITPDGGPQNNIN